jgi:hypothetical protein
MQLDLRAIGKSNRAQVQMIDKVSETALGRHPARRGMRLAQITRLVQRAHQIANHCRADPKLAACSELMGAYWLRSRDELVDGRQK